MNKLTVKKLTKEVFEKFGSFFNPLDCGRPLGDEEGPVKFFPDCIVSDNISNVAMAVSALIIEPRELRVNITEMHKGTDEIIGGFNKDVIFHVAESLNDKPDLENIEVYLLPSGWWVKINAEVWHQAPFVQGKDQAVGIVILPEKTYKNDCYVEAITDVIEI